MADKLVLSGVGDKKRADKNDVDGTKKVGTKVPSKVSLLDLSSKGKSSKSSEDGEDEEYDSLDEYLDDEGGGRSSLLGGKIPILSGIAIATVACVVMLFILLGNDGSPTRQPNLDHLQGNVSIDTGSAEESRGSDVTQDTLSPQIGIQDFTGNTNMSNSDVLTDPSKFVEDITGLTVRVDYKVKTLSSVADFVSYTKHRGTWGGGLELYWLEVTYHDSQYVMQVPFQYYKELSESGIVPVKMEVATVEGTSADEEFTIITYMELDEKTLKAVQKAQG